MSANLEPSTMSVREQALGYIEQGWALCSIAPGSKGPNMPGWNKPGAVLMTPEDVAAELRQRPDNGIGLVHSASGTCAIDVDHLGGWQIILAEYGLDNETLFAGAPRIIGRDGRDKAIFRVPAGFEQARKSLAWPAMEAGGKPVTVFELRGGPVQDVLPPTIHPDTRQPYRWREGTAPFGRDIPMLPDQLLAMWQAWDSFKPQLMALCPWAKAEAKPAPAPRYRSVSTEHGNVIGAFNQAHDLVAVLEAHGYARRGKRLLSPTSSTKLAGVVVFEEGTHCYSHHASDPLNDGHAHDAFDVFCLLDHGGDTGRAVRDAGRLLGIERESAPTVQVDVDALKASADARKRPPAPKPLPDMNGVPGELLRVPGVLGAFCDHIVATAVKPQRVLSVSGALALGSIMMARTYAGPTGLRTNMYLLGVAPSASGKEHARRAVKAALRAIGKTALLGGEDIKSGGAILTRASLSPACLFQLDEFGLLMQSVMSPKASGFQADILTNLMKLYSSADTIFIGPEHANQHHNKRMDIEYPCVSVHGTTTGDTLWEALSSKHVLSGFLNRFVVMQTESPEVMRQPIAGDVNTVPDEIVEWGQQILDLNGKQAGNLHGVSPSSPIRVGATDDAWSLLEAFAQCCDDEAAGLRGSGLDALWGRAHEMALKISAIVAGSMTPAEPRITAEAARWAIAFIEYWTRRLVDTVRKLVVDSEFAGARKAVLGVLDKCRAAGASRRQLLHRWRGFERMRKFEQDTLMETLVANGDAVAMKRQGNRGPATQVWVARAYAPEAMISDVETAPGEDF